MQLGFGLGAAMVNYTEHAVKGTFETEKNWRHDAAISEDTRMASKHISWLLLLLYAGADHRSQRGSDHFQ